VLVRVENTGMPNTEQQKMTVNLEPEDLQKLKEIAKAEGRSLAGQVRFFLARAVLEIDTAKEEAQP
jgi:hypothetical protein